MNPSVIKDSASGVEAKVTSYGQLVTAPVEYDDVVFNELAEPDTAYNFWVPSNESRIVITTIDLVADKQVSSTVSATIIIYEASSPDTTTVDKILYQTAMVQDQQKVLNVNLLVNKGKFVNAKTTDDDIHMNLFGYYINGQTA